MSDDGRRSRRQRSVIAATKNSEDTMRTCVGAAPYRSTPAEDLCFNNYCDIAARVRKANQCRCVRGPHGDADGRTRPTDRRTGSHGISEQEVQARGERKRGPVDARRLLEASLDGGLPPFAKMASSHSSTTDLNRGSLLSPPLCLPRHFASFANTDRPFSRERGFTALSIQVQGNSTLNIGATRLGLQRD